VVSYAIILTSSVVTVPVLSQCQTSVKPVSCDRSDVHTHVTYYIHSYSFEIFHNTEEWNVTRKR